MIGRREFLAGAAAFSLAPGRVLATPPPPVITLRGAGEQGCLMIGTAIASVAKVKVADVDVRLSPQGAFAFGIAYDRTDAIAISVVMADGYVNNNNVVHPTARKYDIQHVNGLPEKYVSPPKDVLERIARENALVGEARKRDSDQTWFADPLDWPAKGIMSGTFGSQRIDNGKAMAPHFGVDIAAPKGTPIHAPADGIVSLAEPDFYLTGGTTLLDHGHGVSTTYIHQDELKVKLGDTVKRGDVIGLVGMKGRATGPHLHWAMNWFQMRLDPSRSTATPMPEKG